MTLIAAFLHYWRNRRWTFQGMNSRARREQHILVYVFTGFFDLNATYLLLQ